MSQKPPCLLLGAHMSISKGFDQAIYDGASIGCSAIQVFTKSNRQWYARALTDAEVTAYTQAQQETSIEHVVAHASYLINVGSPDKAVRTKSIHALAQELERCSFLGIKHLIVHPGAHTGSGEQACLERIIDALDEIFDQDKGVTHILLETMAGQGSTVGYTFEQLAFIRARSKHQRRLGICLDTCHVFAAGYDFRTETQYKDLWKSFDDTLGLNTLKALHLNDSKKPCGSRIDRHEDIGKGAIGAAGFAHIMNDTQLVNIPKIVETPRSTLQDYRRNISVLMELLTPTHKKQFLTLIEKPEFLKK